MKLSEKQVAMVAQLQPYEHRSKSLGGPGLAPDELEQMFGKGANRRAKRLKMRGLLMQMPNKRWRIAEWLCDIMYWRARHEFDQKTKTFIRRE